MSNDTRMVTVICAGCQQRNKAIIKTMGGVKYWEPTWCVRCGDKWPNEKRNAK